MQNSKINIMLRNNSKPIINFCSYTIQFALNFKNSKRKKTNSTMNEAFLCETTHGRQLHIMMFYVGSLVQGNIRIMNMLKYV